MVGMGGVCVCVCGGGNKAMAVKTGRSWSLEDGVWNCMSSIVGGSCYNYKYHFVVTKVLLWQAHVCCNKTHRLSQQKYACHNKTFVMTKLCLLQQNIFVATNTFVMTKASLSWQKFCCNKIMFVMTNIWWDKSFVATKNMFVVASILLLWQKWYLWQLPPMIVIRLVSGLYWQVLTPEGEQGKGVLREKTDQQNRAADRDSRVSRERTDQQTETGGCPERKNWPAELTNRQRLNKASRACGAHLKIIIIVIVVVTTSLLLCLHTYTDVHMYIHTHMYTYTYTCTHIHTHMYTYTYTCTHIHTHMYTYTYTNVHYTDTHMWTYKYIHVDNVCTHPLTLTMCSVQKTTDMEKVLSLQGIC